MSGDTHVIKQEQAEEEQDKSRELNNMTLIGSSNYAVAPPMGGDVHKALDAMDARFTARNMSGEYDYKIDTDGSETLIIKGKLKDEKPEILKLARFIEEFYLKYPDGVAITKDEMAAITKTVKEAMNRRKQITIVEE